MQRTRPQTVQKTQVTTFSLSSKESVLKSLRSFRTLVLMRESYKISRGLSTTEPLGETPELNMKELFTKAAVEKFKERKNAI